VLERHLDLGALATGTTNYTGHHRDWEPLKVKKVDPDLLGVAMGNRSTKPCYGVSETEERDSDPNIRRI
jgi:hypothetical protein